MMQWIGSIVFMVCLGIASFIFAKNVGKIRRNIKLGKDLDRSDNSTERWKTMLMVALGQSKMTVRPIAGILHIVVYAGFLSLTLKYLKLYWMVLWEHIAFLPNHLEVFTLLPLIFL